MSDDFQVLTGGQLPTQRFARLLVFGPTGAGKTMFGATMPGRRAVIATDPNASLPLETSFDRVPRPYRPKGEKDRRPAAWLAVDSWAKLEKALTWLEQHRGEYDSVIIDSGTELNSTVKRQVLAERQESLERGWKRSGTQGKKLESLDVQGWGLLQDRMETLRFRLHNLPAHICWLCGYLPPKAARDDGTQAQAGGPDMTPAKVAIRLPYACDVSLFIQRVVSSDGSARVLAYSRYPQVEAKDNRGLLDEFEPPDAMVILARLGYFDAKLTAEIEKAVPRRSPEQKAAADAGVILD